MLAIVVWLALTWSLARAVVINAVLEPELEPIAEDPYTLKCHKKQYTYMVTQSDENGKQCWDKISVTACWGRCDSNEISDWRFPFKKSNHPVCVHFGRTKMFVTLRYCEDGVREGTDYYEYLDATECKCQMCTSNDTSCEGLSYRPQRSRSSNLGFI
ncbi:thyrostimulin beta-5 subunit-like [Diabrotica virgifera virgifera]|uniref:Glycoprotein hormone subunit beta domain-containing protein n=1 Tax=Diabrotica virgifera virgifera TaxID=50390 RepID=A0ABM5K4E6_DIAVI|nr:thyrostimulin beta-5 subunit-like [Diabrotica virgifera virgifera]XP_050505058.1 thyrostimulin beta-5 subunit-like [Diabrotica virgifera virgifera]XP_050505059.1 thyrostimulin beta-5 subunit-like [Diabrotica virgifera virgifera]